MKTRIEHLYVHVPFCDGKCVYCGFYSELYAPSAADSYLAALDKELSAAGGKYDLRPSTIYFGGGTPAVLDTPQLSSLLDIIWRHVALGELKEWTIEINPGMLTIERAGLLQKKRVNRISMGAQTFDNNVLKAVGRRHTADAIAKTVDIARIAGIDNIGLDLIACLPGVGREIWENDVRRAIELKPRHISVYALSLEQTSMLARLGESGEYTLPDDDRLVEAVDLAAELLEESGYIRYETSNYARPGAECLHNLSCWRGEDYLGVGPSASSRFGLVRMTNKPDTAAYAAELGSGKPPPHDEETLVPLTDATERMMFGFRFAEGVDLEKFRPAADAVIGKWEEQLDRMAREGMTEKRGTRWYLTKKGRHFADHVARELIVED